MGSTNSSSATRQELKIVEVFSSANVPEQIIRESNIKELISSMAAAQKSVQSTTSKLEQARRQQKDGNFIGNWWNDRDDAVQDAQLDLNKSIGSLTQKTSQLLVVNTAISKVLHDQQGVLLKQQSQLKSQADTLQEQNNRILEQQKALEQQQREINAANQGLMEAKGISQEQAQKLVGCITRVTDAEKKIDAANVALNLSVERRLQDSTAQCLERLAAGFDDLGQRQAAGEQRQQELFDAQNQQFQSDYANFLKHTAELSASLEQTLQARIQVFESQMAAQHSVVQRMGEDLATQAKKTQQEASASAQQNLLAVRHTGKEVEFKLDTVKQELGQALQTQREVSASMLEQMSTDLRSTSDGLKSAEFQVSQLEQTLKSTRRNQIVATVSIAVLALAALAWQAALHFALV